MNLKSELFTTTISIAAPLTDSLPTTKGAARDAHMVMLGLLSGGKIEGGFDLSTILYKRMRIEGTVSVARSKLRLYGLHQLTLSLHNNRP